MQLQYDRNREEEPGSSSQSTSRVNSAGGSNFFHGAMMLSEDDVDPEIDSAASSNFVRRLQESSSIQNFSNIANIALVLGITVLIIPIVIKRSEYIVNYLVI